MRLVFAGTPQVAVPAVQALADAGHDIVAVLTRPDARKGRGRKSGVSEVKQWAVEHDVPVLQPSTLRDDAVVAELAALKPDLCPVVAYGALIPKPVLAIPPHGWVNLHFSLLPAWRGAAPVQHAIMAGDEITGASTFLLEPGLDTGPVFGTVTTPIGPAVTSGDLLHELSTTGASLLVDTVAGIGDGTLTAIAQPPDGISHAPTLSVEDAHITWDRPADVIDRQIRGCTPAPGPWTTWDGNRLKLGPVTVVDHNAGTPGEITVERRRIVVSCGHGAIELGTVQPAGKKMMPATDWARGVRIDTGDVLGQNASNE